MNRIRVLIVDDDPGVRGALCLLLEDDYAPEAVESAQAALAALDREEYAVVLSDVAMPGMDGIALLEQLKKEYPELPVVMISAHGDVDTAVRAVRAGAYDYIVKPVEEKRLHQTLHKALEFHQLRRDYHVLREEAHGEDVLLGESPPMQRLREEVERAAPSDARILILGENGTGKELVAKRIHSLSRRHDRPFVKLNSAAIPRELVESELFGHEAGSFTGAVRAKKGKLELATGGTLFLDEIGDMSDETQTKLLRVLSSGEYERVGGTRTLRFDARLVTATHRELRSAIAEGRFREDLYHRIAVIPIRVPALRERGADIELLAAHFLAISARSYSRRPPQLVDSARSLLRSYRWPGNVRELRNLMERIAIMHPSEVVQGEDLHHLLPDAPLEKAPSEPADSLVMQWDLERREQERERIRQILEQSGWSVTKAAQHLGMDRASLHRKMSRLGIRRPGADIE